MTKEQQNRAWACLSKEMRARLKERHESMPFNTPARNILNEVFGYHNLTSDEEPPELLFVERDKAIEEHKCHMGSNEYGLGYTDALEDLFGDKCLIDEDSTVQSERLPTFNKSDKVRIINVVNPMMLDEIGIIEEIPSKDEPRYKVRFEDDHWTLLEVEYIEPYTEPLSQNPAENCDSVNHNSKEDNMATEISQQDAESIVMEGWVARDRRNGNRDLHLFTFKPERSKILDEWQSLRGRSMLLDTDMFPSLHWIDEPLKVKIALTPMT